MTAEPAGPIVGPMTMLRTLLLATLVAVPASSVAGPLTDGERQRLLAHFELTESWLASELAGLCAAQLAFRASPDSWSIRDVVEHLAIAEPQYWKQVEDSLAKPLPATPTRRRPPMPASSGTASTAATASAPAKPACPTAVSRPPPPPTRRS